MFSLLWTLHNVWSVVTCGNGRPPCAKIAPVETTMNSCPACGQAVPANARFCGACGHQSAELAGHAALIGKTIANRYRIQRVIAEGGMGIVYEAEQSMGERVRKVAIKTLLPDLSQDPVVVSRFHRECSVVASLEHPNTVRVYDFGTTEDGTLYIAMEFVGGRQLGDVIAEGPMPLSRCMGILEQTALALEEAHGQGIVHRDLKPDNLVLCERAGLHDFVKVLDFGIAKRSSAGGRHDTKLTQQGMVLGTPPYMSPEQFSGEVLDRTSDIYSLGIIFYEMVNGKLPFEADTPWMWAHQHMTVAPAPFKVAVPADVERVVTAALSKVRTGRPPTAIDFFRRLQVAAGTIHAERSRIAPTSAIAMPGSMTPEITDVANRSRAVRTEPSMFREAPGEPSCGDASTAVGATAPPTTEPGGAEATSFAFSPTGTEPGARRLSPIHGTRVDPRLDQYGSAPLPAALASPAATPPILRNTSRRASRATLLVTVIGTTALGAIGGLGWWVAAGRGLTDEPPPQPTNVVDLSPAIELVPESTLAAPVISKTSQPVDAALDHHTVAAAGTPKPTPSTSGPTATSPSPVASTPPTAPTPITPPPTNPLPFPLPITLPSGFTLPGLPQLPPVTPPTAATTVPPPTPQAATPTATAASMQNCAQATSLAASDLDAAVTQCELCESAVGRSAANPTRSQISAIAAARAQALAQQGNCAEANRVVQTVARIGVDRPARIAAKRGGCP